MTVGDKLEVGAKLGVVLGVMVGAALVVGAREGKAEGASVSQGRQTDSSDTASTTQLVPVKLDSLPMT